MSCQADNWERVEITFYFADNLFSGGESYVGSYGNNKLTRHIVSLFSAKESLLLQECSKLIRAFGLVIVFQTLKVTRLTILLDKSIKLEVNFSPGDQVLDGKIVWKMVIYVQWVLSVHLISRWIDFSFVEAMVRFSKVSCSHAPSVLAYTPFPSLDFSSLLLHFSLEWYDRSPLASYSCSLQCVLPAESFRKYGWKFQFVNLKIEK